MATTQRLSDASAVLPYPPGLAGCLAPCAENTQRHLSLILSREVLNPKTVHFYFTLWNRSGVWENIVAVLHGEERTVPDKEVLPSALVLDSRSTKVVAKGGYSGGL